MNIFKTEDKRGWHYQVKSVSDSTEPVDILTIMLGGLIKSNLSWIPSGSPLLFWELGIEWSSFLISCRTKPLATPMPYPPVCPTWLRVF
jgi:hypothetical protein